METKFPDKLDVFHDKIKENINIEITKIDK